MKNVTISMDDKLLAWVRVEAARSGQSVSRWIAGRLADARAGRGHSDAEIEETIRMIDDFLAAPRAPMSENGKTFDRDEIYGERFRRFDDADLSGGQGRPSEEADLRNVAEGARPFRGADPERSGSE